MLTPLEAESTLTARYQTTVPEPVRRALRLSKRDKLHYSVHPSGEVVLTRAAPPEPDDPALAPFLRLLTQDITTHPERLQAIDAQTVAALQTLVQGVDIDLDAPLPPDDPTA